MDNLRNEMISMRKQCRALMSQIELMHPGLADMHRVRIATPIDFFYILQAVRSRAALRADFDYWFQVRGRVFFLHCHVARDLQNLAEAAATVPCSHPHTTRIRLSMLC